MYYFYIIDIVLYYVYSFIIDIIFWVYSNLKIFILTKNIFYIRSYSMKELFVVAAIIKEDNKILFNSIVNNK